MKISRRLRRERLVPFVASDEVQNFAKSAKDEVVNITIEKPKRVRSTGFKSQNHHFNGHAQQIARETGNSVETVRAYIKHMAIDMGYPILMRAGNPVLDLWGNLQGISEADSTSEECALLIEAAHLLAAELDIRLTED